MSEVLIAKQQNIEHHLKRVQSTWQKPSHLRFAEDYDKQDIIVLNLQQACQETLAMAKYFFQLKKLNALKKTREVLPCCAMQVS